MRLLLHPSHCTTLTKSRQQRGTETERESERQRQTDRDRQTQSEKERQRQTEQRSFLSSCILITFDSGRFLVRRKPFLIGETCAPKSATRDVRTDVYQGFIFIFMVVLQPPLRYVPVACTSVKPPVTLACRVWGQNTPLLQNVCIKATARLRNKQCAS